MSSSDSPDADDEGVFLDDDAIIEMEPGTEGESSPDDPWTQDVLAHLDKLENSQRSWVNSLLVLVLTIVLFGAAQLVQKSAENLAWLVTVLLIHESGHFAGMKLFGYRDVRMFFLPFFGAAVTGRSHNIPGWQTATVILLGPLPGIAIGAILGTAALVFRMQSLQSAAMLFAALNGFNLLPFMPLDGGRLLQLVLFGRQRHLEALFQGITGVLLAGLGFTGGGWILGSVGILMLIGSGHLFRVSTVARQTLAELGEGWQGTGDFEHIPESIAREILHGVRGKFPKNISAKTAAGVIRQVWDRMQVNPPGLAATLVLLSVYAVSLVGTLVVVVALAVAGRQVAPAGLPAAAPKVAPTALSGSTTEQVCQIVAGLKKVDRSRINVNTSLAELHADELDFLELVMQLEDHFRISIPDDAPRAMMGSEKWNEGAKNVTVGKLVELVEERLKLRSAGSEQQQPATPGEQPASN